MLDAIEVGGLAATTAAAKDPRTLTLLTDTLAEESTAGWLRLEAQAAAEHITLLALDVEMIERRSDALRVPVKAALVQCALADGDPPAVSTLFDGFVDPSVIDASWTTGDASAWDYKETIVGHSHADLLAAHGSGLMRPLRELQRLIATALNGSAFIVGHNLQADLRCLRLHGACLGRRLIDTQCIYRRADGKSPSLKTLVDAMLVDDAAGAKWRGFQTAAHDPALDAEAPLRLVLRELSLLQAHPGRMAGEWSGGASQVGGAGASAAPAPAPAPAATARFKVVESDVGKVLGKAGANINALRQRTGCKVTLADRGPGKSPAPRLLELSGSAQAVALAAKLLVEVCPNVAAV